ncbi:hypothetical protein [Neorhodopirellula lusitana]|nr:hypothetical protein [Neorhodopirellula lusitana]
MTTNQPTAIKRVILVSGLLEPRCLFWPLKQMLLKQHSRIDIFNDRVVMRDTRESVQRLGKLIRPEGLDDSVGIVSHSFGDWVSRQAIANTPDHCVRQLVSVTPGLKLGLITAGLHMATLGCIPELNILSDPDSAFLNLDLDDRLPLDNRVRRTVIWSRIDECVRKVSLEAVPSIEVLDVWATHLTAVLQPNVMRMIAARLT